MFTLQIANILASLQQANVDPAVVDAFSQLGNCMAPLEHRGPVLLQQEFPSAPAVEWDVPLDDTISVLKASNPFGRVVGDRVLHGWAGFFEGPVNIRGDMIIQPFPGQGGDQPDAPGAGGNIIFNNPTNNTNHGNILNFNGVANTYTISSPLYMVQTTGTITARSSTTLGSGNADFYSLSSGVAGSAQAGTVLNPYHFDISSGTYGLAGTITNGGTARANILIGVSGTFEYAYSLRNNADQSVSSATATTATLDTKIHKYPDDNTVFELSASEITIKQSGLYRFSFVVPYRPVSADVYTQVWLEEGGTKIKGSCVPSNPNLNSTEADGIAGSIVHKVDVSGGNKVYRLRFVCSGSADIVGADDANSGGYARLDITRERNI